MHGEDAMRYLYHCPEAILKILFRWSVAETIFPKEKSEALILSKKQVIAPQGKSCQKNPSLRKFTKSDLRVLILPRKWYAGEKGDIL